MKTKLFTALVAALALAPLGALADGGGVGGGVYVFPSRIFAGDYPPVNGPYPYQAGGAATVLGSRSFAGDSARSTSYTPFRSQYGSGNMLIQAELARLGYYHGPLDGNVGPGTRTEVAIESYQRDHRLAVTGAITGDLIAALSGQ
jgi:hypothetical protein